VNLVRKHYQQQHRFDASPIASVQLNLECRDELVPILLGLQHLYSDTKLRRKVVSLIETNIHYPTESSLILDGVRKFVPLCIELARDLGIEGWRQADHLVKKIKKLKQNIGRVAASLAWRKCPQS